MLLNVKRTKGMDFGPSLPNVIPFPTFSAPYSSSTFGSTQTTSQHIQLPFVNIKIHDDEGMRESKWKSKCLLLPKGGGGLRRGLGAEGRRALELLDFTLTNS